MAVVAGGWAASAVTEAQHDAAVDFAECRQDGHTASHTGNLLHPTPRCHSIYVHGILAITLLPPKPCYPISILVIPPLPPKPNRRLSVVSPALQHSGVAARRRCSAAALQRGGVAATAALQFSAGSQQCDLVGHGGNRGAWHKAKGRMANGLGNIVMAYKVMAFGKWPMASANQSHACRPPPSALSKEFEGRLPHGLRVKRQTVSAKS